MPATSYWFSDGYGDYLRQFERGMASVPEWAPPKESHLLGSTSVVRSIHYGTSRIDYLTFDDKSREVLKLCEHRWPSKLATNHCIMSANSGDTPKVIPRNRALVVDL